MKTKHPFAFFVVFVGAFLASHLASAQSPPPGSSSGKKPNIVVIWGDDIGT